MGQQQPTRVDIGLLLIVVDIGLCRKVSVIGRTYRGSLPSQAGQHEDEEKEKRGENVDRTSLELDQMYKMRLKLDDGQFVKADNWGLKVKNQSENGPGQYGGNQSENGDGEMERDGKDSLYLGGDLSPEKIGSLCSVCSRSISSITPSESLVHPGSRLTCYTHSHLVFLLLTQSHQG